MREAPTAELHTETAGVTKRTFDLLAVLAFLLPPSLLLQRQIWVLPHTGLGNGLGLLIAVAMVLLTVFAYAGNMLPPAAHLGPVPRLLLLWALLVTWSFFIWSCHGLPQLNVLATVGYVQNIGEVLFVLALMGTLNSRRRYYLFIRLLATCGALYGLILILTALTGNEIGALLKLPFLQATDALQGVENERGGFIRPQGMAGHPLEAGVVATVLTPIAVALARSAAGRQRIYWWTCAGILALGSLATLSRSATIGLVLAVMVMSLRWPLRTIAGTVTGAVLVLALLILAAPDRFAAYADLFSLSSTSDSSLYSRQFARQQAFAVMRSHFWAGRGVSSHALLGGRTLDNQLLGFAVEQGVPVMIMFLLLLAVPAWHLVRHAPALPAPEGELAGGLAGSLTALLACSAVLDVFGFPQIRLLTFVLIALVGPLTHPQNSPRLWPSLDAHAPRSNTTAGS